MSGFTSSKNSEISPERVIDGVELFAILPIIYSRITSALMHRSQKIFYEIQISFHLLYLPFSLFDMKG